MFCFPVQPKVPTLTANVTHSVLKDSTVILTCTTQSSQLNSLTYIFLHNQTDVLQNTADRSYTLNTSSLSSSGSYSCVAQYAGVNSSSSTAKEIIVVGKSICFVTSLRSVLVESCDNWVIVVGTAILWKQWHVWNNLTGGQDWKKPHWLNQI